MRPINALIAITIAATLLAPAAPVVASGPIYAYLKDLPRPIAKLHTCIGPRQRTLLFPDTWLAGGHHIFRVGCPENAPGITLMPQRDDSGYVRKPGDDPDRFESTVYYVADDGRGRNARRLVLPFTRVDGTTVMADAFDDGLSVGWSTREETSVISGLAYFDVIGRRTEPPRQFMVSARVLPPDRPEITNAQAIWLVKNGKAELIYWAETRDVLPKDAPPHRSPPYTVVLDKRPEK